MASPNRAEPAPDSRKAFAYRLGGLDNRAKALKRLHFYCLTAYLLSLSMRPRSQCRIS